MANTTPEQPRDRRFQTRFVLDDKQWKLFMEVVDRPPIEKPRLRRLLSEQHVAWRRS